MSDVCRLYGLTIRSELPLHQQRPAPDDAAIDLEVTLGPPMGSDDGPPPGRVLLQLATNRQHYTATKIDTNTDSIDGGYRMRFYGTCDVTIDLQLRRARISPVHGADLDVISVLVAGSLFAFVLAMRGAPVLHASAVQVDAGTVAFVGGSGMGKSTMATLLCARGALLITDDLLRLDLSRDPPGCELGATELRLRKAAGDLSEQFSVVPGRRRTGDARDALSIPLAVDDRIPLRAIVVPLPDRSAERATIERLGPKDAFLLLSRFPRLLGWQDKSIMAQHFQFLGEIADRVPVHVASLPWGPPFPNGLADDLLAGIGLAAPAPAPKR